MDIEKRHSPLDLYKNYTSEEYPTYDTYDAIHVNSVADIPCDYAGVIGVPITFLDKHDMDQFEIVGEFHHGTDGYFDLAKPVVQGKEKYVRIAVRNKKPKKAGEE